MPQSRFRNETLLIQLKLPLYGVGIGLEYTFHSAFLPLYSRKASAFKGNLPLHCAFIVLPQACVCIECANVLKPSVQMSVTSARLCFIFVFPAPYTMTGME